VRHADGCCSATPNLTQIPRSRCRCAPRPPLGESLLDRVIGGWRNGRVLPAHRRGEGMTDSPPPGLPPAAGHRRWSTRQPPALPPTRQGLRQPASPNSTASTRSACASKTYGRFAVSLTTDPGPPRLTGVYPYCVGESKIRTTTRPSPLDRPRSFRNDTKRMSRSVWPDARPRSAHGRHGDLLLRSVQHVIRRLAQAAQVGAVQSVLGHASIEPDAHRWLACSGERLFPKCLQRRGNPGHPSARDIPYRPSAISSPPHDVLGAEQVVKQRAEPLRRGVADGMAVPVIDAFGVV
jgi:hypothetical protein